MDALELAGYRQIPSGRDRQGQAGVCSSDAALLAIKGALTSARAFCFTVLSCRIYEACGDNKAKVEVSVGPDFQVILNGSWTIRAQVDHGFIAKFGHLEVILSVLLVGSLARARKEAINQDVELQSLVPTAYDEQQRHF